MELLISNENILCHCMTMWWVFAKPVMCTVLLYLVGVASPVYRLHVQLCHVTFTRSPPLYHFIRATSCTGLPATGEVTEVLQSQIT